MHDTMAHTRYVAGEVWDIGRERETLGETLGDKKTHQPVRVAGSNPFGSRQPQQGFNRHMILAHLDKQM
jgi:hypothetical protein